MFRSRQITHVYRSPSLPTFPRNPLPQRHKHPDVCDIGGDPVGVPPNGPVGAAALLEGEQSHDDGVQGYQEESSAPAAATEHAPGSADRRLPALV